MRPRGSTFGLMRRKALIAALAVGASLGAAVPSDASHVRPKGATPFRMSLVPAFKQCAAPNRTHGAPLSFQSCNPPQQVSDFVTVGTPDANGAGANSVGYVQLNAIARDVRVRIIVNDLRCTPGTTATVCRSANAADGPDYSGELRAYPRPLRLTDHENGSAQDEAGTLVDIPFPLVDLNCADTPSTLLGGTCAIDTTVNALGPGYVKDGKRTVWELAVEVHDGGPDGRTETEPTYACSYQASSCPSVRPATSPAQYPAAALAVALSEVAGRARWSEVRDRVGTAARNRHEVVDVWRRARRNASRFARRSERRSRGCFATVWWSRCASRARAVGALRQPTAGKAGLQSHPSSFTGSGWSSSAVERPCRAR